MANVQSFTDIFVVKCFLLAMCREWLVQNCLFLLLVLSPFVDDVSDLVLLADLSPFICRVNGSFFDLGCSSQNLQFGLLGIVALVCRNVTYQ